MTSRFHGFSNKFNMTSPYHGFSDKTYSPCFGCSAEQKSEQNPFGTNPSLQHTIPFVGHDLMDNFFGSFNVKHDPKVFVLNKAKEHTITITINNNKLLFNSDEIISVLLLRDIAKVDAKLDETKTNLNIIFTSNTDNDTFKFTCENNSDNHVESLSLIKYISGF